MAGWDTLPKNKLGGMINVKQLLLNCSIAKYHDLSVVSRLLFPGAKGFSK